MSLFLFFALFVLVLVIYLIFFKMMYLSYEKLQSQHDADQARHLLVHSGGAVPPHLRQHRERRRMNRTSGTT